MAEADKRLSERLADNIGSIIAIGIVSMVGMQVNTTIQQAVMQEKLSGLVEQATKYQTKDEALANRQSRDQELMIMKDRISENKGAIVDLTKRVDALERASHVGR